MPTELEFRRLETEHVTRSKMLYDAILTLNKVLFTGETEDVKRFMNDNWEWIKNFRENYNEEHRRAANQEYEL